LTAAPSSVLYSVSDNNTSKSFRFREDNLSRTLYVHVGPMKTGTTAIQRVMQQYDNSLIIYPKVGLWNDGSHHGLVFKFFGEPTGNKIPGDIDGFFAKIAEESKYAEQNVLISSETLIDRDCEGFIRALLPHVSDAQMKVEILVACREHFSKAASLFNHRLREGVPPHPDQFLQRHAASLCYAPLIKKLQKSPFKVTTLNYHPSESWVTRFLAHVGLPEYQIPQIEEMRVSLSPKATIAKLGINRLKLSKEERHHYLRRFKKMPESRVASKFIFGPEAAAAAERIFSEDRQFLLHERGLHLAAPDIKTQENMLFINAEEFSEIVAVAQKLGPHGEEIVQFARQYLRT
jgi:hypothetical protein